MPQILDLRLRTLRALPPKALASCRVGRGHDVYSSLVCLFMIVSVISNAPTSVIPAHEPETSEATNAVIHAALATSKNRWYLEQVATGVFCRPFVRRLIPRGMSLKRLCAAQAIGGS